MDEIRRRFGFHRATGKTGPQHQQVRKLFINLGAELDELIPDGREKTLAMVKLQESAMWANAAVAMQAPLVDE